MVRDEAAARRVIGELEQVEEIARLAELRQIEGRGLVLVRALKLLQVGQQVDDGLSQQHDRERGVRHARERFEAGGVGAEPVRLGEVRRGAASARAQCVRARAESVRASVSG